MIKSFLKIVGLSLSIGALCLPQAWGQNLSVQNKIERAEIKTGEQTIINFTVRTNDLMNTQIVLPQDTTSAGHFEVLASQLLDTINIDKDIKEIKGQCIITSFDSTLVTIPPVAVQTPQGSAQAKPMTLNVVQPQVDVSKPDTYKDIKSPWRLPYSLWDIIVIVYSNPISWVIMLLMLIFIIWRETRYLKGRKGKPVEVKPIFQTPLEEALGALNILSQKKLVEQGFYKQYYTVIVDVLKTYIIRKRDIPVLEMTTSEILETMRRRGERTDLTAELKSICQLADMVKFAKYKPLADEAYRSIEECKSFLTHAEDAWTEETTQKENQEAQTTEKGGTES